MSKLVSILVPLYNQEQFVRECIESLLKQTYSNTEIIIINDACTDRSMEVVRSFDDRRIKVITNDRNIGLAASVNNAIRQAQGHFLARMDADDISHASRISKQVAFLENNESVDILGSAMQSFGYSQYTHFFPTTHEGCKTQLLFNVCFGHPTVVFRRSVFENAGSFYRPELKQYSEEYDVWCRIVDKFTFANLPEVLLQYRTFPPGKKAEAENKRRENSFKIRNQFIQDQFGKISEQEFVLHDHVSNLDKASDLTEFQSWLHWLERMKGLNEGQRSFSSAFLNKEVLIRTFELYYRNTQLGFANWLRYWRKGSSHNALTFSQQLNFFLKSVARA